MPDTTQNLVMPFILPAQAQKHVTHNEALLVLDGVVQLCVEAVGQNDPPASFADGQIWAVGSTPTGAWVGHVGALAMRAAAGWLYITPREGWRAWDRASGALRIFRNGAWGGLPLQEVDGLGIGTGSDATNRLAVVSPATLLSHAGAGHQLKINKAGVGETGSLLFQTNWSGRAEMGLSGSDAFAIKVSANGASWADALVAAPDSGRISLPAGALLPAGSAGAPALAFSGDADTGLFRPVADQIGAATGGVRRWLLSNTACQIDVPVTGLAVTQNAGDTTTGRLMKTGDFGLGGGAVALGGASSLKDRGLRGGTYQYAANAIPGGPETLSYFHTLFAANLLAGADRRAFLDVRTVGSSQMRGWLGATSEATGDIHWDRILTMGTVLGTVSQTAGVPDGAVVERGSNANGDYVRFADGTQICVTVPRVADLTFVSGAVYRGVSAVFPWPANFSTTPFVVHTPSGAGAFHQWGGPQASSTASTVMLRLFSTSSVTGIEGWSVGIGRWF